MMVKICLRFSVLECNLTLAVAAKMRFSRYKPDFVILVFWGGHEKSLKSPILT